MEIDWSEEWKKKRELSRKVFVKGKETTSVTLWDEYPDKLLEAYEMCTNYPGAISDRMMKFINSDTTILDVGAGSGAYTIPFLKIAKEVTVVEPSKGQINRLLRRSKSEGIDGVHIIKKRWEDVCEAELDNYDVVNAAHCFHMPDIQATLQTMLNVTKRVLFLVAFSDSNLMDVYQMIVGKHDPGPDYIYLYNVLYQMGIHANVEIFTNEFLCPWDVIAGILRWEYGISHETEERVLEHLKQTDRVLEEGDEVLVTRRTKDAFIWSLREG